MKEGEVQKKSIQLIFESKNAEDASATNRELSKLRRKVYELGKEKTQATQELSYLILTLDEKEEMLNESGKRITELEQENLHLKENLKCELYLPSLIKKYLIFLQMFGLKESKRVEFFGVQAVPNGLI